MTYAIPATKVHVSADVLRNICMILCVVMVLSFVMVSNTQVAFCTEATTPTDTGTDDPGTALTQVGETIATVIYKAMRSLITPFVILAFAYAGFQFLLGGNQGTEKAKKSIIGAVGGLVLVVFAPIIGQFIATQFMNWGTGDLSTYNPLN